ncbi:hypothetical protein Hamer_G000830, partial [Homarus americanus]
PPQLPPATTTTTHQPPQLPLQPPQLLHHPPRQPLQPPQLPHQPPQLPHQPPQLPLQPPQLPHQPPLLRHHCVDLAPALLTVFLMNQRQPMYSKHNISILLSRQLKHLF